MDKQQQRDDQNLLNQDKQNGSHLVKIPAYALLKHVTETFPMTEKTLVLGRMTPTDWNHDRMHSKENQGRIGINLGEKVLYYQLSSSKKVSKQCLKIYLSPDTDEFHLINLNKNTILVDRQPVRTSQEIVLFHSSLIQISSDVLFFFLLPHEQIEKKKKWIKDRRRELLDQSNILNPPKNKFDISQLMWKKVNQIEAEQQERMKVGLGKRLNLKEMLMLQKMTKEECVAQMGLGYMPIGTKAPPVSYNNVQSNQDKADK